MAAVLRSVSATLADTLSNTSSGNVGGVSQQAHVQPDDVPEESEDLNLPSKGLSPFHETPAKNGRWRSGTSG